MTKLTLVKTVERNQRGVVEVKLYRNGSLFDKALVHNYGDNFYQIQYSTGEWSCSLLGLAFAIETATRVMSEVYTTIGFTVIVKGAICNCPMSLRDKGQHSNVCPVSRG